MQPAHPTSFLPTPRLRAHVLACLCRSGHCQQLAPKWRKLAEALHGVVRVAAVNCEQQQGLCQEKGVRGYPTIKAFRWVGAGWRLVDGAGVLVKGAGCLTSKSLPAHPASASCRHNG